ncbi:NUDIX hydrolase [Candidatus Woesebacteria bacterium]|nr:NUDIX hydrolase [Candidatus Woesebacteria bacterium]
MSEKESKHLIKALKEKYALAISGGIDSGPSRKDDGLHSERLLPEELAKQTLGAFVVLLREKKKGQMEVLLVKRKDYKDLWNLPGGGIDKSETFAKGAIREAYEETGLHVKLVEGTQMTIHAGPLDNKGEIAGDRRYDRFEGAIGVIGGGELSLNQEAAAIQWFPVNDLPEGMYTKHRILVHDYFSPAYFYELKKEIFFAAQNHSFIPEGISE